MPQHRLYYPSINVSGAALRHLACSNPVPARGHPRQPPSRSGSAIKSFLSHMPMAEAVYLSLAEVYRVWISHCNIVEVRSHVHSIQISFRRPSAVHSSNKPWLSGVVGHSGLIHNLEWFIVFMKQQYRKGLQMPFGNKSNSCPLNL